MFKRGQKVYVVITGAGQVSKEEKVVLSVTKKGVLLDNGDGNDPSGPFDKVTGADRSDIAGFMPGWSRHIEAIQ